MDLQEAVATAKQFVSDLFRDEDIAHLGLEEVQFDEQAKAWHVTVGFSRPWQINSSLTAAVTAKVYRERSFKEVDVSDETGTVISITDREAIREP